MVRNVTFLTYFTLLLLAIVNSGQQPPAGTFVTTYTNTVIDKIVNAPSTLMPDSVNTNNSEELISANTYTNDIADPSTDIIPVPDAPQTQAYVPTSIKDFKMADPAEGVSMINAPTANNSGNAVLSFNMKLPDGRLGMQPDLGIQYNNEGGSSWLGTGWNMAAPAVSIETRWGSPRYDAGLETEMYQLNGEQLAPVNNRSELVARASEKRFYQRVEGPFNKIIRHGTSPANYWWEVTNKNGVRNFFGGRPVTGVVDNAVLKDDQGNIGYWALVETREPGDNFVHYVYENVSDPGVDGGTVPGQQLYYNQILYTGSGTTDGPYKIEFTRDRQLGEAKRRDVTIDGRLGFKMVSADLLRKVTISLNNAPIRSYEYAYEEGAFYKTLLKSISELDVAGNVFYTHNFDYYDDVNKQDYTPTTGVTSWNIPDDGIRGDIENPIPGFTDEGTAISTSKAQSRSFGVAVTFGSITGGTWSKNTTVGGSFNYGEDYQQGLLSMIDINGDGLPDKVFTNDAGFFYRPNLGIATHSFGEVKRITGIGAFNTSKTVNIGGGAQVVPPAGFLGFNFTRSTTTTNIYFTDFNGDGLMDIAANGTVYFNHLDALGNPSFGTNSALTPSPIFTGSIDKAFLAIDTALQRKQEEDFPLQDAIRMWEAPAAGTVSITATIQLVDVPQSGVASTKKDGVRASIQLGGVVLDTILIAANDHAVKAFGRTGVPIQKGQRIYFRLQSRYNGEDDLVNWDPVIQYTTPVIPQSDVHHKVSNYYKASADFILHGVSATGMGKTGSININGTFKKDITSDSVWVMVTRTRNTVTTTLFEKVYSGNELFDDSLKVPGTLPVLEADELHFLLSSRSYIDRSAMQWKPHYEYVAFADATPVKGSNGSPTIQGNPVPGNYNFNNWLIAVPPVTVALRDTVTLWPQVAGGGNGTLWFSVKGTDTVYARRRIFINGGTMSTAMDSIHLIRNAGEPLFMEFATDTVEFAQSLQPPQVLVYRDSAYLDSTGVLRDTTILSKTVPANLYTNPATLYLGPLFRGWGQFAFKGDKGDGPLDETKINLDELNGYPSDPNNYMDSTAISGLQSPTKTNFQLLLPNAQKDWYGGYDTSVYVSNNTVSSARLFVHDVSIDSLMAGESVGAADKVSTTQTTSFSGGVTPGVTASAGTSFATTVTDLDMMDMNGDRYPDVLNDNMIQYTLPNGGLGPTVITQPVGSTISKGFSWGVSLGGNFIEASTQLSTAKAAITAQKTAKNSSGLSGSINTNDDESITSWIDINGDGLVDRIINGDTVLLNLGYRFAAPERWGLEGIDKNHSVAGGAGLGVNIESGSFEAGIGLSRTVGDGKFVLNDVNGDGLPDQMIMSGSDLLVRLNTGSGFGTAMSWKAIDTINTTVSTGESINGAFSIVIPILFLKIVINPTVNIGHGVSGQQASVMDLDGDGFADMLQSENDGHLTASASSIGRTNMLRKVKGALSKSYFSMDYERVGNTYDMPQSKWVLKNVEVFDGVPGDGIDTTRKQFSYEGGYQDRFEREFYGFSKVITRELNTAKNNSLYRTRIQQYLNTDYYSKGLLASEWLEDSGVRKFTQTNNLYDIDTLQTHVRFPALQQTEQLFYEGTATASIKTAKEFKYDALGNITQINDAGDGTQQDMSLTTITYHNNDAAYIKSVPASIEITTADGVKRKTTTTINSSGSITSIRKFLADGTVAVTDMDYDNYSNLSKLTRPANYKNQRMSYSYEYDDVTHSFITKVTDAFGYISTNTWDYRFGALTGSVSMHNEQVKYELDDRGRLSKLTGPYELAAGRSYTIAFDYNTNADVAYAITRHYDPEHNADINIINFADGLGRSVQVKKQVAVFKGKDVADEVKMVVSGSDLFDPFGRVEQSYYPITEPIGAQNVNLNTGTGDFKQSVSWDVRDRVLKTALADGATTSTAYSFDNGFFSAMTTDALGNRKEILTDVRERKRFAKEYAPDAITTRYDYNALSELLKVTDSKNNVLTFTYDNLGRKLSEQHPDAGKTEFTYDLAGNLLKKITAQIRKEIPNLGAIQYQYEYERLTDIDYPRNYQNKVKYTYGRVGSGSKAGRIVLQQDASGGQEFFYGRLGEITKVIRTVLTSPVFATTYVSEQEYDTWNRLKKITYPDGEVVSYHYNKGGGLLSMEGQKQGHSYKYVDQSGYDEYEQRTYLRYGNGAETQYTYDNKRRRLTQLKTNTAAGRALQNNTYSYDAVNNVLGIVNDVQAQNDRLGGYAKQDYHYDNLYRLDSASGTYNGFSETSNYGAKISYDNLYNIVHKRIIGVKDHSYDQSYTYGGAAPHQATQIGQSNYRYDENGNQLGYGDVENYWDEENRLVAVMNKGVLSQYTYDADGERVVRSSGGIQGVWLNGAPAGAVRHTDNYTVYVSPFISCQRTSFTKHYFIEDQRIATKLGHGTFTNISFPRSGLTAGNVDYTKRAAQIEQAMKDYYASLGVSPGPPTDKNYWARPENSGIPAPVFTDSSANNVPRGWPGNTTPPPNGPPIFVDTIPSNDSVKAGYGFHDAGHLYESSQYFYHPDHLGSTSYVSNTLGEVSMHFEYSPFGETFFEEHTSSYITPYLFKAKGRDEETGYYYYGARYNDPVLSQWLSVDQSGENVSGYGPGLGIVQNNGSSSATMGSASVSDVVFGDAGTGMALSALSSGGEGEDGDKSKKGTGNKSNTNLSKAGMNKGSNPKPQLQNLQNMNKKAFRLPRNAAQYNGMFFNHALPNTNNNNSKSPIPRTRPRR
jgi:RHS repeat-associated protein